jgi:threonylcarbamoyladenosine tRNA methylthiotransferase MtaB
VSSFYVQNFGCRATQADGAVIERDLLDRGLVRSTDARNAEVVVLNTCTVTSQADRDVRATIRRVHRENPSCRILVTGCYAQRAPEALAGMPGVSWIVGNSHKYQVGKILTDGHPRCTDFAHEGPLLPVASLAPSIYVSDIFAHTELTAAPVFDGVGYDKTRPNLKVQDGCDSRCSFCVIPFVRGQSRSLRHGDVLREVDALVAAGFREIVISGINLGRWGRDLDPEQRFEDLVRNILAHTGVDRLRLSSIEPMDWTDELIELVASSPQIAKHAHVPLQTGSDSVLRRMHRKYRPWHYEHRVRKIRAAMPHAAIGSDVMVGFPGETEAEFKENRQFIASLPFTYLHVFTYSPRPGTPAAESKQVRPEVKRERNRILRELATEKKRAFMQSLVRKTVSTITLSVVENGRTESLTDNYQKLWLEGEHGPNQIVSARVQAVGDDALIGLIVDSTTASSNGPMTRSPNPQLPEFPVL